MSSANNITSPRPGRWGLAAKLFAILLLLGAVAVLMTSVLGYMRARDALQESIYNQLIDRPQEQGAPGRDLLPHHPQRAEPARHRENGDRRCAGVPSRLRRARAIRRAVRGPPQGRRLVRDGLSSRNAPRPRQGVEYQRLPAERPGRLLSPVPLHRRPIRIRRTQRKLVDDPGDGSAYSASTPSTIRSCAAPLPPSASSTSCWPIRSPAA